MAIPVFAIYLMAREKERTLAIKGKQCIRIGLLSLLCCQILIPVLPPLSTLRPARFDKPRQHVLHELHRPGADAHPAAARLLPVRPAQMRDAEQLLFGVRDVATLPGGKRIGSKERNERRSRCKKIEFPLSNTHLPSAVLLRPSVAAHPLPSSPSGVDSRPSPGRLRAAGRPRVPHRGAGRPAQTLQRLDNKIK